MFAESGRNSVAGFMIGSQALGLVAHFTALLLRSHLDFEDRFVDIFHCDKAMLSSYSKKCRFIHQVFKIRTGKPGCALRDGVEIHIITQLLVSGVDLQDRLSSADIRQADIYLAVKAAGTEQRVIKNVRTVGRRHDNHAFVVAEAVHLNQQLVQCLLPFVVPAAEAAASLTADGVDFIDEDNRGSRFLCLLKQVSDTAGADTDIEFDKVRAGDRQELYTGFSGDSLGQEGLTGSRRPNKQDALRNSGAHGRVGFRIFQEFDDLGQFFLFFVAACHIGKGLLVLLVASQAGSGLAEAGHPAGSAAHTVHHHIPEHHCSAHQDQVRNDARPPRNDKALVVIVLFQDAFLVLFFDQLVKVLIEHAEAVEVIGLLNRRFVGAVRTERQNDFVALCPERLDLSVIEQIDKLRVVVQLVRLGVLCHREDDRDENQQKEHVKADIPGTIAFWVQISSHPF